MSDEQRDPSLLTTPKSSVIYFLGDYANFYDSELAGAFVAVLKHHGIQVHVPEGQTSSGMAMISAGDLQSARTLAEHNLRELAELAREGFPILCTEPTTALCLKQEYRMLLDLFISDMTCKYTVEEIYHEGQRRHIAFTPVNTMAAVAKDAHLAAREFFVELDHPGMGSLTYPGAPYRHSETPWRYSSIAPRIGEHNFSIYSEELGISAEEMAKLQDSRVI